MVYPAPPPAPKSKKRTTITILIVIGAVFTLCCSGVLVGGFLLFKNVSSAVGPAQDTADTFLDHLEADNTGEAYSLLCSRVRGQFTQEQFAEIVKGRPKLTSHGITNTNVMTYNGKTSASVNAELSYSDGSSEAHLFKLAKEGDDWRVCGNPY